MVLSQVFEPTAQHRKEDFWTTTAIQQELSKHLRSGDVPSLKSLGLTIKKLRWKMTKNLGVRGYYLRLR